MPELTVGVLTIRLNLSEPAPGRLVTQAITSPFVSVLQTGGTKLERVVAVNNNTGAVLAQLERPSN